MKKNEFLTGLGLVAAFVIVFIMGTSFAPAPKYTIEVKKDTTIVLEEAVHFVYENTYVMRSDSKVLSHDKKLLSVY